MAVWTNISSLIPLLVAALAYFYLRNKSKDGRVERVYKGLLREERSVNVSKDFRIAVGFGSCMDIIVDGLPLLKKLGYTPPEQPTHHELIQNDEQLSQTFVYFLREGAAAE